MPFLVDLVDISPSFSGIGFFLGMGNLGFLYSVHGPGLRQTRHIPAKTSSTATLCQSIDAIVSPEMKGGTQLRQKLPPQWQSLRWRQTAHSCVASTRLKTSVNWSQADCMSSHWCCRDMLPRRRGRRFASLQSQGFVIAMLKRNTILIRAHVITPQTRPAVAEKKSQSNDGFKRVSFARLPGDFEVADSV